MKVTGSSTLANSIVNTAETVATPEVVETVTPLTPAEATIIPENNEHLQTDAPVEVSAAEKSETVVSPTGKLKTGSDSEEVSDFIIPSFEEEKNTPQSTPAVAVATPPSWKEILKSVDKKEILKELGVNDFAIEVDEHISRGGQPIDYFNAKAVDWNKISDADVILGEMKKEFPDATPAQLQRLFNKKYNQTDLNDEEEKEDGELLMKSDARRIKQAKIAEQQSFKIPEMATQKQDVVSEEQKQQQELFDKKQQELQQLFNNHEATKSLLQSKRVAVNVGVDGARPINYNIDPKQVMDVLFNPEVNNKFGRTKTGEPDVQLAYEMALFKMNPTQFKKDLYNAGVAAGHRKELETGQNAQKPTGTVPVGQTKTLGEAFKTSAKNGTLASHIV